MRITIEISDEFKEKIKEIKEGELDFEVIARGYGKKIINIIKKYIKNGGTDK